jgi:hypothetical protein
MSHNVDDSTPPDLLGLEAALENLYDTAVQMLVAAREVPTTVLNLRRLGSSVAEAVSLVRVEVEEALSAVTVLAAQAPLADEFPDGKPRPSTLSPRQVLYLNDLAVRGGSAH